MPEIPDNYIISLCCEPTSRDKGFALLMQKYQERVYWHIRRIVIDHDDANDVTQNVFIKIWKNLDSFRNESKLFSWIYRIATNEALSHLKTKRANIFLPIHSIQNHLLEKLSEEDNIQGDEIELKLQKALIQLPGRQRLVFNMKYFEHMSYEEISQILNTSIGGLKATFHVAVKKIEKILTSD